MWLLRLVKSEQVSSTQGSTSLNQFLESNTKPNQQLGLQDSPILTNMINSSQTYEQFTEK